MNSLGSPGTRLCCSCWTLRLWHESGQGTIRQRGVVAMSLTILFTKIGEARIWPEGCRLPPPEIQLSFQR